MRILPPFVVLFLALNFSAFGQVGSVSGQVPLPASTKKRIAVEKYTGKISGKVAKPKKPVAGVWLSAKGLSAPKSPKAVTLNQENYQFGKSMMIVARGTEVFFPNLDPDFHNIYSLSRTKKFDLGRYKKNDKSPSMVFDKAGLVKLRCEIHKHMQANLIVVESPYFVATDAAGKFTLKNVPAGTYTLNAQLDKKTKWSVAVTVQSGKQSKVTFSAK